MCNRWWRWPSAARTSARRWRDCSDSRSTSVTRANCATPWISFALCRLSPGTAPPPPWGLSRTSSSPTARRSCAARTHGSTAGSTSISPAAISAPTCAMHRRRCTSMWNCRRDTPSPGRGSSNTSNGLRKSWSWSFPLRWPSSSYCCI